MRFKVMKVWWNAAVGGGVRWLGICAVVAGMAGMVGCASDPASEGRLSSLVDAKPPPSPILRLEFISEHPPTAANHASTLVETRDGILASWFGGSRERNPDVTIWTARFDGKTWTAPVQVADGIQADGKTRYACWNPVLFQPKRGPLLLFYKVGPSPSEWWGMLMTSTDEGHTWSKPVRLPDGQVGPVRNKPLQLSDGSLLCGSSSEDDGWKVHMELTRDLGKTWEKTPPLNRKEDFSAIQPTIFQWRNGKVLILNRSKQGVVTENWMQDNDWKHWSTMKATSIPNPNSGIDGLVLRDGRAVLVFNHSKTERTPIGLGMSLDGLNWDSVLDLEDVPGAELSYPACIQTRDGLLHVTYTWKRERIRHVIVDPKKL